LERLQTRLRNALLKVRYRGLGCSDTGSQILLRPSTLPPKVGEVLNELGSRPRILKCGRKVWILTLFGNEMIEVVS
jgi:hypothetical protein